MTGEPIFVDGKIDGDYGRAIEESAVARLRAGESELVLDVESVDDWDSDGLESLQRIHRLAASKGIQPVLLNPSPRFFNALATMTPRISPGWLGRQS